MAEEIVRKWSPIQPLPADWTKWNNPELHGLVEEWRDQRAELENRNEYRTFLARLQRQWAIETGVLERLYTISDAATKTLIEKGLDSSLINHDDTDKEPWEVLAMIKDQHNAIETLYAFVKGDRPLGTSFIKELHSLLTQHQDFYDVVDSLGRHDRRRLIRGDWKQEPNYIEFQAGGRIDFCPPFEVDPEMRSLIEHYQEYEQAQVPPDILAACFHEDTHRNSVFFPRHGQGNRNDLVSGRVFFQVDPG